MSRKAIDAQIRKALEDAPVRRVREMDSDLLYRYRVWYCGQRLQALLLTESESKL